MEGEFGGEDEADLFGEDRGEGDEDEGAAGGEEGEGPPPPRDEDKELLFLIEFLVDTLSLCPENMNLEGIDPCALQGPTSVVLTFLHFPPMYLGEKDTDPERRTGNNVIQYNSGKSLMFALTESQFEEPPCPVFLHISATKDMPHAFRFTKLPIGKAKIDLSELFKQVYEKYDEFPDKTVSKSIKDCYVLSSEDNKPTADVTLYIRLTCLGQNIVTEFQKAEDPEEPMLFKNKASRKVYECKEAERSEDGKGQKMPGWGDGKSCEHGGHGSAPDPDDDKYEEILAQINSSFIRVKVEKSRRKDPPKPFHVSEFCDCDIPLPQDLVAGMSDLSLSRVSEGSVNFPGNTGGEASGQGGGGGPDPTDKRVALSDTNNLVFNVPPVNSLVTGKNTLVYNVNTCQNGNLHGHKAGSSYRVLTDNNIDGPPPKMPNDPEKDVFILRIIKRGKSETGKGSLSLEFKTPKEKIELPKRKPYFVETGVGPEKSKKK